MAHSIKRVTLAPFVYQTPSLRQGSCWIIAMLFIQLSMLVITKSYQSIMLIGVCTLSSCIAEFVDNLFRKRLFHFDLTAIIHGLISGMFLPESFPPLYAFFIMILALLLAKYAFGGIGTAWANTSAFAVIIAFITCPSFFPPFLITADALDSNIVSHLISSGNLPIASFDAPLADFFNTNVLNRVGVSLPEGYLSLFWDTGSTIPAFRFNAITLFSSLILLSTNVISCIIPLLYISTYAILVRLFSLMPFGGDFARGDILIALLTSGTLFAALFVIQSYGTTPLSRKGKVIYGILSGTMAFALSGCGTSPVGTVFTILIMNIISPFIQIFEDFIYSAWLNSAIIATNHKKQEEVSK